MQDPTQRSWLQKWFLTRPIHRIFTYANLTILVLLIGTLSLGVRQYMHYQRCSDTVAESNTLNFQFNTLQQYLSGALIEGKQFDLDRITRESQQLTRQADRLQQNTLVPDSLKSYLLSEQKMTQLLVKLHEIRDNSEWGSRQIAGVITQLNTMAADLQQLRLQLNEYTQNIISGLHKVIIGFLGLFVGLSCMLLYSLNQSIARPLLELSVMVHRNLSPAPHNQADKPVMTMQRLLEETQQLVQNTGGNTIPPPPLTLPDQKQYLAIARGSIFLHAKHALTNLTNGILNYTQQLIDLEPNEGAEMQQTILTSLYREEERLAALVRCLRKCTGTNQGKLLPVAFTDFIENLKLTLAKSMASQGVQLHIQADPVILSEFPPLNAISLLICMTILEGGCLCVRNEADPENKWVKLTVERSDQEDAILIFSNGVGDWQGCNQLDATLWPDCSLCSTWMQQQGGMLVIPGPDDSNQNITIRLSTTFSHPSS